MKQFVIGYDFNMKEAFITVYDKEKAGYQLNKDAVDRYGKAVVLYSIMAQDDSKNSFMDTLQLIVLSVGASVGFSFSKFSKKLIKELKTWSKNGHPVLSCSLEDAMKQLLAS
jgi:hypothetical protein